MGKKRRLIKNSAKFSSKFSSHPIVKNTDIVETNEENVVEVEKTKPTIAAAPEVVDIVKDTIVKTKVKKQKPKRSKQKKTTNSKAKKTKQVTDKDI